MECEQTMSDNADRMEMLSRAEMRWMSVKDAKIEVTACALAELGRDWQAAEAEVARLRGLLGEWLRTGETSGGYTLRQRTTAALGEDT